MLKRIGTLLIFIGMLCFISAPLAYAVLPNIFSTQPAGTVAASLLDTNFTFLESQGVQGLTTTGSSNAYVATPTDAWLTGYTSYVARALTVKPSFTNTGASTINVSGLGTAAIYKNVAGTQTALSSGDIVSGTPAILICDGVGFLLANPTSGNTPIASIAKMWAHFTVSGSAVSLAASYNTTSATYNGTGNYTFNFTTPFASANYACTIGGRNGALNTFSYVTTGRNTGSITMVTINFGTQAAADITEGDIVCFGAQ